MSSHYSNRWPEWKKSKLEETGLSEEKLELLLDSVFDFVKISMENPTMPVIKLGDFANLKPSVGKLTGAVKRAIWNWRNGNKSREGVVALIKKVWPIRNRLINEYNGEFTAKNWHQYFKASVGKDFIVFVKNRYTKPRTRLTGTYRHRKNTDYPLN